MDRSASCLAVASIFIGFAIAVLVLRIRYLQRKHPAGSWSLARPDSLVLMAIVLSLLFVIAPLLAIPHPSSLVLKVAQGSCATSAMLLGAHPFAILDQRRIDFDAKISGAKEGVLFVGACVLAASAALAIFWYC